MSSEMTTTTTTSIDLFDGDDGLDGLDRDDLIIPRYVVVQPSSDRLKELGAREGHYYSVLSGEQCERIRVVFLSITKGRLYWPLGEDRAICRSDNAIVPSPSIANPQCDLCAIRNDSGGLDIVCSMAKWMSTNGETTHPECRLVYTALGINLDAHESPFLIHFKSTHTRPIKQYASWIKIRRQPVWAFSATASLTKTKNAKGTFYVPLFTDFRPIDPADKYRDAAMTLRNRQVVGEGGGDDGELF